eukprot:scaffold146907_cov18-Tisochrysis_lutea.AAC.1
MHKLNGRKVNDTHLPRRGGEVAGKGRKRKLGKDELARTGNEEGQRQQGPVFRWKRERKK